jgi:hypothetical protein
VATPSGRSSDNATPAESSTGGATTSAATSTVAASVAVAMPLPAAAAAPSLPASPGTLPDLRDLLRVLDRIRPNQGAPGAEEAGPLRAFAEIGQVIGPRAVVAAAEAVPLGLDRLAEGFAVDVAALDRAIGRYLNEIDGLGEALYDGLTFDNPRLWAAGAATVAAAALVAHRVARRLDRGLVEDDPDGLPADPLGFSPALEDA